MSLDPAAEAKSALAAIADVHSPNAEKLRRIRKQISRRLECATALEVLAIAYELIDANRRWIGYELVNQHSVCLSSLKISDVESLGQNIDSWSAVDAFAAYIAGPCWVKRQISDAAVARWARRGNRWWRRSALVATTGLNVRARGGYGDTERTLAIARLLRSDRDDMVVKALSWALRELIVWDAEAVRRFLSVNEEELAPRVLREVRNKLQTGLKSGKR
ncbi:MAG: DNA alkylation repair protein [Gammaproteobacteria bacterium]|nr:DNA alkylation repair protein [Gammaproteobacteria bacterium]